MIVIDTDSPSRDVLEHLVMVSRHTPRPVVMFASDGTPATIRAATRAGVSAYVVDGLDENRIKAIVDVAVARFEELQDLRGQLAEANSKLAERKLIERAKGLLMKSRSLDEEAAYAALRRTGDGSQAEAERSRAAHRRRRGSSEFGVRVVITRALNCDPDPEFRTAAVHGVLEISLKINARSLA